MPGSPAKSVQSYQGQLPANSEAVGGIALSDLPFCSRTSVTLRTSVSTGPADADVYFLPVTGNEIIGEIPSTLSFNPSAVLASVSFNSKVAVLAPGTKLGFYTTLPLAPRSAAQVGAEIIQCCSGLTGKVVGIVCPPDAISKTAAAPCVLRELLVGALLGSYTYPFLKRRSAVPVAGPSGVIIIAPSNFLNPNDSAGIALAASAVADGCYLARDLVITPPNILYPESFAACVRKRLAPLGVAVDVLDVPRLEQIGAHGLLAVGRGSRRRPVMIVCSYTPSSAAAGDSKAGGRGGYTASGGMTGGSGTVMGGIATSNSQSSDIGALNSGGKTPLTVIVGKGITMDTGGINIKTTPLIREMKGDMGGAAVAIGAMATVAALQLPTRVACVLAVAENMPDGDAYRPGDVLQTAAGTTVEVLDTDCEGRVAMADALWYASWELRADRIVDVATLTGGVVAALGHACAGVFANGQALEHGLVDELRRCGHNLNEDVWPLPIGSAYMDAIKSDIADIKNIGESGRLSVAPASTAAAFLSVFVPPHIPWAHLDVAGTHLIPKHPLNPRHKGNPSWGVRLLTEWLASLGSASRSGTATPA